VLIFERVWLSIMRQVPGWSLRLLPLASTGYLSSQFMNFGRFRLIFWATMPIWAAALMSFAISAAGTMEATESTTIRSTPLMMPPSMTLKQSSMVSGAYSSRVLKLTPSRVA